MMKIFNFGKIDFNKTGRKSNAVEVRVELRNTPQGPEFIASGSIWNHKHTDIYCTGQCLDTIKNNLPDDSMQRLKLFNEIYMFWKLYHLNGMHAGTVKQEEMLKLAGLSRADYTIRCQYLDSIGLLVDDGYKYGSSWLYREIPESDLNRIKRLLSEEGE